MSPRLLALLLLGLASIAGCREDSGSWRPLGRGVAAAQLRAPGDVEVQAVRVDLGGADVRVIDARRPGRERATVDRLREETEGAVAVVNGGFFDPSGKPLGLVLADGRERNRLRNVDWGVFWVAGTTAGVVHTDQWATAKPPGVREALQSGPRLVVAGKALKLKKQTARRTVACVPKPRQVVLLTTEAIDAAILAEWLAREPEQGGLGCWHALNLDGGPSTQLSLKAGEHSVEVEGGWGVPNGLAVVIRAP
ncbi:MAG: phosphodiester glycosidase family protein [Deltaproteobacteria bacterium]|nr:phosphodiester glycosidase family protein [Deltaproteobacteria bacterium]